MKSLISRSRITICKQVLLQSTTWKPLHHYHYRRWYASNKVSVWWDMDDDCAIPACVNANITRSTIDAFRTNGILQFSKSNLFNLVHIPNPDDTVIRNRMEQCPGGWSPFTDWVSVIFPPAHNFFICNHTRFTGILNNLRTDYNIIWYWKDLVKGEDPSSSGELLPGRRSWYIIYKGICENPFFMSDQTIEDVSNAELWCHYRHRPVPEVLVLELWDILECVPGGLTITELRNELEARKVSIDEVFFYGYQNFLHLLQALPYIIDVQSRPDSQFIVCHATFAVYESLQRKGKGVSSNTLYCDYDYEHRRVPGYVMDQLCRIVEVHPEGLSIAEFKNELEKSNEVVDYEAL